MGIKGTLLRGGAKGAGQKHLDGACKKPFCTVQQDGHFTDYHQKSIIILEVPEIGQLAALCFNKTISLEIAMVNKHENSSSQVYTQQWRFFRKTLIWQQFSFFVLNPLNLNANCTITDVFYMRTCSERVHIISNARDTHFLAA